MAGGSAIEQHKSRIFSTSEKVLWELSTPEPLVYGSGQGEMLPDLILTPPPPLPLPLLGPLPSPLGSSFNKSPLTVPLFQALLLGNLTQDRYLYPCIASTGPHLCLSCDKGCELLSCSGENVSFPPKSLSPSTEQSFSKYKTNKSGK